MTDNDESAEFSEPTPQSVSDPLNDGIAVAPDDLPSDDDPDVVDGMAKLELLRQMEDIERLRE